jgi:hypothetical protein
MFPTFASTFLAGTGVESDAAEAAGVLALFGAGDPVRLGSVLMVRSLPCVSMMAAGNSANFASKAVERRDLATAKRASTAGEVWVERFQPNWERRMKRELQLNGEMDPHSIIRGTVKSSFMRNFWDREGSIHFCPVAGCTRPIQCNLAVIDGDQSEQINFDISVSSNVQ